MEAEITFKSDGLTLTGAIHVPEGLAPGEQRPAMILLPGFGGAKDSRGLTKQARMMCEWGYVALRIDHRGCGTSEGVHGRVLCHDRVADARNALTWLAERPEVDGKRIGIGGDSFGAAVSIYTGGVDDRVACVVSIGGWGDGARKFRGQHPTPEAWERFTAMLEEGRRHRERTGTSMMVSRWDIVPIPEHLRHNLSPGAIMEFPAETAQSMYDFRPDDVVGYIAPRPLLLIHASRDSVTPTEQSIELFKRTGQPTDLFFLSDMDHFAFADENSRLATILKGWLTRYFPVERPR